MTETVLLVDDDRKMLEPLRELLCASGFMVLTADGGAGIEPALARRPDVVVLDVRMPGMNGIDTLVAIRRYSAVPVLLLTEREDDAERIAGLNLGADDCVAKPCSPRELEARIRALTKRMLPPHNAPVAGAPPPIIVGSLKLWPAQRRAERDGAHLALTSTEFGLLEMLARNAGRPVTKAEMSLRVLGRPLKPFDRSIDVHVSSIRSKLGTSSDGRSIIQTVTRKGYQLIVDQ
jgi:DNA-binding response OmpR family regulator